MKKTILVILYVILAIVICLGSAVAFFQIKGIPKYEPENIVLNIDVTEAGIKNGRRLGATLCAHCHAGSSEKLTGKAMADLPKEFGTIYSKNITQDHVKGIGSWTDGQLYYFLRTGVRPDGQYVPPYMPKWPLMADEDLKDIIAWLRSESRPLEASSEEAPESQPSLLVKILSNVAWSPLPLPKQTIQRPDTTDMIKTGEYYANAVTGCYHCHSKDFKTVDALVPEKSEGFYGGGNPLLDFEGRTVVSSNLTFHETGIAAYSEDDFVAAVRGGKKEDGTYVRYPMMPFYSLSEKEVRAIYSYLKTVPPIENDLKKDQR